MKDDRRKGLWKARMDVTRFDGETVENCSADYIYASPDGYGCGSDS
jgi:hypothetical protein